MDAPWVPRNPRPITGPAQVRQILELAAQAAWVRSVHEGVLRPATPSGRICHIRVLSAPRAIDLRQKVTARETHLVLGPALRTGRVRFGNGPLDCEAENGEVGLVAVRDGLADRDAAGVLAYARSDVVAPQVRGPVSAAGDFRWLQFLVARFPRGTPRR